jgi:hypothetical protein
MRLTSPNPELDEMRKRTPDGMAFWAGTYEKDRKATCRLCQHWSKRDRDPMQRYSYYANGRGLRPGPCVKYQQMMHKDKPGPGVPHDTPACKYFEPSVRPPARF